MLFRCGVRSNGNEVSTGSGSDRVVLLANSSEALIETRSLPLPVLTVRPRAESITQPVLKEKTSDLNRRPSIHGWADEQRANQAALAIDVCLDTADGFTA